MKDFTKHFIDDHIAKIQELEELGGPDTLQQYITVLTALQIEIQKRINSAVSQLE
jgi:hypothetical protein